MPKENRHYFKPIYCHEGREDPLLQLAVERSEVVEEEIHLCGYFCIITSKKMTSKDVLELYKSCVNPRIYSKEISHVLGTRRSMSSLTKLPKPGSLLNL